MAFLSLSPPFFFFFLRFTCGRWRKKPKYAGNLELQTVLKIKIKIKIRAKVAWIQ